MAGGDPPVDDLYLLGAKASFLKVKARRRMS